MPIYEYACAKCRKIYSFLSKRLNPERAPVCPRCGNAKLERQLSSFAMLRGVAEPAPDSGIAEDPMAPDLSDPKVARAMGELEQAMDHLDESNPKHVAQMLRKMKDIMPSKGFPKEFETAIRRLEAGEDPEKIEADMGDVLSEWMGEDPSGGGGSGAGSFSHDPGLYDL